MLVVALANASSVRRDREIDKKTDGQGLWWLKLMRALNLLFCLDSTYTTFKLLIYYK